MTLADVLAALAGLAIAGAGFASISVILSLFVPNAVERAGARIANRLARSLGLGLLLFLGVLILAGSLLKVPFPLARLAAIGAILGGFSLAVLGGAAMAATLARRSRASVEAPVGLRDLLRGVFLLETAVLLPIVGWFVVLPAAFLISLGAGFHAVLRRGVPAATAAAPVPQG